jgi:hypothetical protein
MQLETKLEIVYVECPPEHVPVWREGIRLLIELAKQQQEDRTTSLVSTETGAMMAHQGRGARG